MKENSARPEGAKTTESVDALKVRIRELEKEVERWKSQVKTVRYGLNWIDVPEAFDRDSEDKIPVLEEVSEKAINAAGPLAGSPPHVIIEGDNYHALTCLNYTHRGKIDVIYIDPPYNTGSDGFTYKDKRFLTEYPDGKKVPREDPLRHSYWLSFMEKRLKLAKNLLSDKGVIFISIDDNEQANLKLLCDKVFGEGNFVANISWQRTYSPRNDSKGISAEIEHILVYSKRDAWMPGRLPRDDKMNSKYKNPDGDITPWTSSDAFAPSAATHQGMVYGIQHPFTGKIIYPYKGACWPLLQEKMFEEISKWGEYEYKDLNDSKERADVCGISENDVRKGVLGIVLKNSIETAKKYAEKIYSKGKWPKFYFTNKGKGGIRRKTYIDNVEGKIVTNFWPYEEVGHTDSAKKEIVLIFGEKIFDTPKPTALLQRIIQISSNGKINSTVLDFFAGSGTTLHATLNLNREDGGNRRCILVQQKEGENNICESVTYERNRRVMCGYTNAKGESVEGLGGSLKYYKTGFVGKHPSKNASDADKVELAGKAGCLIALAENTLETVAVPRAASGFFQIYADNAERKRYTCIYHNGDYGRVPEFIARIDELRKKDKRAKFAVYVFSWNSPDFFENEFDDLTNIEIKAIPKPILEIYKALNG